MLPNIIQPIWFFLALGVGIAIAMWYRPDTTVVVKQPTPYNVDHTVFKDTAGSCYRYDALSVQCPASGAKKFTLLD